MFKIIHNSLNNSVNVQKLIYPRISGILVVHQRFKYQYIVWKTLNKQNYRQLPARMHLIFKWIASCSPHGLFSTDNSPVCPFSQSPLGFTLNLAYSSPAFSFSFSFCSCFPFCRHIQLLHKLTLYFVVFKISFFNAVGHAISRQTNAGGSTGFTYLSVPFTLRTNGHWRDNQNQNFSHWRVTIFSYPWCSARAELRYY